jgi:CTP synthase
VNGKTPKYIVVTGGVLSGLGKGITVSSIGRLLKARGYSVTAVKIDPYLNCDAGTMNPYQHGEVFVLDDGGEVDLDLGNYERFLDIDLGSDHNITTGKVYRSVIEKERKGDYLGKTVQIIPHITNEIKERIMRVAANTNADMVLIELGGTVGDIESMPFIEAVRQLHREVGGEHNCIFVHTTLIPIVGAVGEQKTKPTQHSVKEIRALGIQPDMIVGRSEEPMEWEIKKKISLFCDVSLDAVVSAPDAESIYEVPVILETQGVADFIVKRFALSPEKKDLGQWKGWLDNILHPRAEVNIALVGKYTHLKDSYLSYIEALHHCMAETKVKVNIVWVEADDEKPEQNLIPLNNVHGMMVAGGFGYRGVEGKIAAIKFARENRIPFLGVCLGFQLSVIEFCRNVLELHDANSTEFAPETKNPVIDILPEQKGVDNLGGTMRLGAQDVFVQEGSVAHRLYGAAKISERHRHRYEVNPVYIYKIEEKGLKFTGKCKDGTRMEIAQLDNHPFFLATQFHPEFKSRLGKPSPPYLGLVRAAMEKAGVS